MRWYQSFLGISIDFGRWFTDGKSAILDISFSNIGNIDRYIGKILAILVLILVVYIISDATKSDTIFKIHSVLARI